MRYRKVLSEKVTKLEDIKKASVITQGNKSNVKEKEKIKSCTGFHWHVLHANSSNIVPQLLEDESLLKST